MSGSLKHFTTKLPKQVLITDPSQLLESGMLLNLNAMARFYINYDLIERY